MKTLIGLAFVAALAAVPVRAADQQVPNINGPNPTAASQLPSEAIGAPTPTFPAGRNQPPSRGGTLGYEPELEDEEVRERLLKDQEARQRTSQEPEGLTAPSYPAAVESPGALRGGPQPY